MTHHGHVKWCLQFISSHILMFQKRSCNQKNLRTLGKTKQKNFGMLKNKSDINFSKKDLMLSGGVGGVIHKLDHYRLLYAHLWRRPSTYQLYRK